MDHYRSICAVALLLACPGHALVVGEDDTQAADAARAAIVRRVDELVDAKIRSVGFDPAARASDAEFLRRVYLDLTGVVPRVAEGREFLADQRPDKRSILIDKLLESPGHATHLANTWRNVLLP
ncbi:MAG TPA: DUF1549 domain-containing protein, partial [Lacunisphaera sp.]|nr:DUF1549 domain-containing protein [Lacunisphaera sp.]